MSFFQNVFTSDFEGNWLLGDRHHIPKFVVRRNAGRGDELVVSWNEGPYDLSGTDADSTSSANLKIEFALHDFKSWVRISIDVTAGAVSTSAVTAREVVSALNADTTFAERFIANIEPWESTTPRIMIRQRKPATEMRFWVRNGGAEEKIRFNARAGIAEMPVYFDRHSMEQRYDFEDCQNQLILMDPSGSNVDLNNINNAVNAHGKAMEFGWDGTTELADWALLEGRSGLFDFTSDDGSTDPNTKIIYPAGAKAGDLSQKVVTNSGNTFVIPYTLTDSDLITPP